MRSGMKDKKKVFLLAQVICLCYWIFTMNSCLYRKSWIHFFPVFNRFLSHSVLWLADVIIISEHLFMWWIVFDNKWNHVFCFVTVTFQSLICLISVIVIDSVITLKGKYNLLWFKEGTYSSLNLNMFLMVVDKIAGNRYRRGENLSELNGKYLATVA